MLGQKIQIQIGVEIEKRTGYKADFDSDFDFEAPNVARSVRNFQPANGYKTAGPDRKGRSRPRSHSFTLQKGLSHHPLYPGYHNRQPFAPTKDVIQNR